MNNRNRKFYPAMIFENVGIAAQSDKKFKIAPPNTDFYLRSIIFEWYVLEAAAIKTYGVTTTAACYLWLGADYPQTNLMAWQQVTPVDAYTVIYNGWIASFYRPDQYYFKDNTKFKELYFNTICDNTLGAGAVSFYVNINTEIELIEQGVND